MEEGPGDRGSKEGGSRGAKAQTPPLQTGREKPGAPRGQRERGRDRSRGQGGGRRGRGWRRRDPKGGAGTGHLRWGGRAPPGENADLTGFTPECAHLLLQGVYGDFLHHNDRSHLDGRIVDNSVCQCRWRRIPFQSTSWYATPSGVVGHHFTAILPAEWHGVLVRSSNSERPLVFAHVILTKTLGVRRALEIRARITQRINLL